MPQAAPLFTLGRGPGDPLGRALFSVVARPLERVLALSQLEEGYRGLGSSACAGLFASSALGRLRITPTMSEEDLQRIPASGALLAVCNHPFGAVEGLVLAALLSERRSISPAPTAVCSRGRDS